MLNSNEVLNGNFAASRRFSATHQGIDLKSPNGTLVKSRYAGVVRVTGTNPPGQDFGNYIRVFHPQLNQSTWYAHLQSFSCHVGQQVSQGQVIGRSNNTGYSTGPHLHFGQSLGETLKWVDPDTQTEGGGIVVTQDLLNAYFLDLLGRLPDPGANATYIGKHPQDVYHAIRTSTERNQKLAREAAELNDAKAKASRVPELEQNLAASNARIVQLDAQATDNLKAIEALGADNKALYTKIAELEKKLLDCESSKPTAPSLEDAFRIIIETIKKILGGGEK